MIFSLMLLLQSAAPSPVLPTLDEVKLRDCLKLVAADAKSGIVNANEWARAGTQGTTGSKSGYFAEICLASGYAADGQFAPAADKFASAARAAEKNGDLGSAKIWAQAGNAALDAGNADDALRYLNNALLPGKLLPEERIAALIDRARALVSSDNNDAAMADLAEVRRTAPNLGQGWLLSATLARRSDDLAAAQGFIKTAGALYPSDPAVALEAGNIAAAAGANDIAREQWQQTILIAPASAQAAVARNALAQLAAMEAQEAKASPAPSPPAPAIQSR